MAGIGQYKMVKLYEYTVSKNANGNNIETLALRHRTFADVTDNGGGRSVEREQTKLSKTKRFKIKWRSDWVLNSDWKIRYLGESYTIENIERINEARFNWLITATAK